MKTTWGNWTRDGRSLVHDGYGNRDDETQSSVADAQGRVATARNRQHPADTQAARP